MVARLPITKQCGKCQLFRPPHEFVLQKTSHDGLGAHCRSCRVKYQLNDPKSGDWPADAKERLRLEFVMAYGGECHCCGEQRLEFLTVEHLDGSGAEHRREVGTGAAMLRDLRRRKWPQDNIAVACFNCNMGRERTFMKICPHQGGKMNASR